MTPEANLAERRALLDDFYTECEEQLAAIRARLTELDAAVRAGRPASPEALEALFRNLHTLKGNAAIVGLHAAEEVAHAAEDFLRLLLRQELSLDDAGVERLAALIHQLEELVGNSHAGTPAPAPDAAPRTVQRVVFTPTRERDARGVNVGTVRERLGALGRIRSAQPIVRPGGQVTFEFTIEAATPLASGPAWVEDGVAIEPPAEDPPAPPARPAVPAPGEAEPGAGAFVAPSHIVRVDLSRLNDLMRITGELIIQRSRLGDRLAQIGSEDNSLREVSAGLTRTLRELREGIMRVRLVSIAEIFSRIPFVVRDLVRGSDRKVHVAIEGQETEIDKHIVERLKEPLLHLVRNAMVHGFEPPEERVVRGKPAEGTLRLRASTRGDSAVIQVIDDGRGIDPAAVARRARALGLPVPETLDAPAVLGLLCQPGFSTRETADLRAGRGVGMDVVRTTVRELGGTLALQSTPGRGTEFTLRLPLTLAIVDAFIVTAGAQTCAVPRIYIEEIVEVPASAVQTIRQVEVVPYRDGVLPLVRLREWLDAAPSTSPQLCILVVNSDRGSAGLVVDRVQGQREVVVQPLHDPLVRVPGVSGATELGDGRPVLILDTPALTSGAVRPLAASAVADAVPSLP